MLGRELRGEMLSIAHLGLLVSAQGLPDRLGTLVRLFLGELVEPWGDVERCFRPAALDALLAIGALRRKGARATSGRRLVPFRDLALIVDRLDDTSPGAVREPDRSTASIASFAIARRGQVALDVGTGSGVLAILAARRHRRVVALDINAHAIELARWNAALNGARLDAAECAPDSFAGLRAQAFDLVTFAMPFLFTDDAAGLHERSPSGARIFEDTYAGVARVLGARGQAVLWHQIPAAPGAFERRLAAVPGSDRLSVVWNGPISEGVGWEMGRALVSRRKRGAPPVVRVPVPNNAEEGRLSDRQGPREIARHLRTLRLLATADLDGLVPRVQPYVTAQRSSRVVAGRLCESDTVRIGDLEVSPAVLEVLEACDGRTVRALARRSGDAAACRTVVRRLAEAGVISLE